MSAVLERAQIDQVPARRERLRTAQMALMAALTELRQATQAEDAAAIEVALAKGEALLAAPWIDTRHKQPEPYKTVLGWITRGPFLVPGEVGQRDLVCFGRRGWLQHDSHVAGDAVVDVSHYQELAAPPAPLQDGEAS